MSFADLPGWPGARCHSRHGGMAIASGAATRGLEQRGTDHLASAESGPWMTAPRARGEEPAGSEGIPSARTREAAPAVSAPQPR